MNNVFLLPIFAALTLISGCGEKSVEYYAANPKEALEVILKCQAQGLASLKDQNCVNAIEGNARAVREASNKQRDARRAELKKWRDDADAQMKK